MTVSFSGSGQVVSQVIQAVTATPFSTTSSSLTDITGLTATITPRNSANKILVQVVITGGSTDTASIQTNLQLVRGATNIAVGSSGTIYNGTTAFSNRSTGTQNMQTTGVTFLDSPATTSATTYKMQGQINTGTLYVNRDSSGGSGSVSSITLYEIAYA
jgi:hypothetical protein